MKLIKLLLTILFFLCTHLLYAQFGVFKKFSIQDGLVQSQVTSMVQDQRDFLFIGTCGGVSIFDGNTIEKFKTKNSSIDVMVEVVYRDINENLWFYTKKGVYYFDGKSIQSIDNGNYILYHGVGIMAKFFSYKNKLYLYDNAFLYVIENNKLERIDISFDSKWGVLNVLPTNNGVYVVTKNYGLLKLNETLDDIEHKIAFNKSIHVNYFLNYEETTQEILLNTREGLMNVHLNTGVVTESEFKKQFTNELVYRYFKDSNNGLWFATLKGGIYHYKDGVTTYFNYKNGFTSQKIITIFEDNQGNVWFGTDGDGVMRFKYGPFFLYDNNTIFNGLMMVKMHYAKYDKRLYMTSLNGDLVYFPNADLQRKEEKYVGVAIKEIACNPQNETIILDYSGLLYRFKMDKLEPYRATNLLGKFISNYASNEYLEAAIANNVLWINEGRGWLQLEYFNDRNIRVLGDSCILLFNSSSVDILFLKASKIIDKRSFYFAYEINEVILTDNLLYLATTENGVVVYNIRDGKQKIINAQNGLGCNFVYNLLLDDSLLWVGTGCGLDFIKINHPEYQVVNYSAINGIPKFESTMGAIQKVEDKIYMINNEGVMEVTPSNEYLSIYNPKIILKRLLVFSKEENLTPYATQFLYNGNLPWAPKFPSHFTHLTFDIKAVILGADNIRYKYQLIGGVDDNIYEIEGSSIMFPNLQPGKYQLKLWSTNSLGQWEDDKLYYYYEFEILTPFYQTWWARVAFGFFILAIYFLIRYLIYKQKLKRIEREEALKLLEQDKVKQRTAEDFHDEIGNKLTKINLLSSMVAAKSKDNEELHKIITQLQSQSQSLYKGAKDIIWSLQPQSNYLHQIVDRMVQNAEELLQLANVNLQVNKHFPEEIDWNRYKQIKMDDEVSRNLILICKEIFNNITKYANASRVEFDIYVNYNQLKLKILDDGSGFDKESRKEAGNGLANMQRRAKRIHASLVIESEINKGTAIELVLKFASNHK